MKWLWTPFTKLQSYSHRQSLSTLYLHGRSGNNSSHSLMNPFDQMLSRSNHFSRIYICGMDGFQELQSAEITLWIYGIRIRLHEIGDGKALAGWNLNSMSRWFKFLASPELHRVGHIDSTINLSLAVGHTISYLVLALHRSTCSEIVLANLQRSLEICNQLHLKWKYSNVMLPKSVWAPAPISLSCTPSLFGFGE